MYPEFLITELEFLSSLGPEFLFNLMCKKLLSGTGNPVPRKEIVMIDKDWKRGLCHAFFLIFKQEFQCDLNSQVIHIPNNLTGNLAFEHQEKDPFNS